jgi:3-oxoacyl-[acyl-carrier-protein] synthase II
MSIGVAITGLGVVSALGYSAGEMVSRIEQGELAVEEVPWTRDQADRSDWWAPIKDFEPALWMDEKVVAGTNPFAQYALAAAVSALNDAGLDRLDPIRTAVLMGTTIGGASSIERAQFDAGEHGLDAISPKILIASWPNMAAAQMAMRWDLHGPCLTMSTACASSLDAIGTGARLIRSGVADVALVGGVEAGLGIGVGQDGFVPATGYARALYGMSAVTDDPAAACLPFDRRRGGMVMGEGAGMLVLESAEHAAARGAPTHAWIEGYGSLSDGHHPSSPDPSGRWEMRAMQLAIEEAGISPADVDAIAAHGTGTPKGDAAEIRAINGLFGERATPVPVMSLKGALGHPAGASGALSLIAAVHGMNRGEFMHTPCTAEVDPEVEFEVVLHTPTRLTIEHLQVNAFGFGGQNASLVLRAERNGQC